MSAAVRSRVGVVGTGAMGLGVLQSLLRGGFAVGARDILPEAQAAAVAVGAASFATPAALVRDCPIVILLVVDAAQIEEVLFGTDGAANSFMPGAIVIVSSTVPPPYVAALAPRLAACGARLIDAPVSGGPRRAANGTMTVMISGDAQMIEHCADVFAAISGSRFVVGARPGDAAMFKVLNNQLAAVNLAAGAEALAIAAHAGLDLGLFIDVVGASSGASWIFEDRMRRALDGNRLRLSAMTLLKKDVGIAVDTTSALGCDAPLARAAQEVFDAAVAAGYGAEDDASLLAYCASVMKKS